MKRKDKLMMLSQEVTVLPMPYWTCPACGRREFDEHQFVGEEYGEGEYTEMRDYRCGHCGTVLTVAMTYQLKYRTAAYLSTDDYEWDFKSIEGREK